MERKVLTSALKPGTGCLSIEQLGRYADGALSFADREAAASHVNGCANCQAELALLHSFTSALIRDDEQTLVRSGVETLRSRESEIFGRRLGRAKENPSPFFALRAVLSVAAVLIAVVGGYYLLGPRAPSLPADIRSGGPADNITRALAVPIVGPSGDQAAPPERFEWRNVSGAVSYHVQLMEVDRRELWSADTTSTAVEVPADVQAQIVPGKTLLWHVTAFGAANAPIAQSDMQRFRVNRP